MSMQGVKPSLKVLRRELHTPEYKPLPVFNSSSMFPHSLGRLLPTEVIGFDQ